MALLSLGQARARSELLRYYAPSRIIPPNASTAVTHAIESTIRVILHSARNEPAFADNADAAMVRVIAQSDVIDREAVEEQVQNLERLRGSGNESKSRQDITNTVSTDTDDVFEDL